jgi:hypothetical protein
MLPEAEPSLPCEEETLVNRVIVVRQEDGEAKALPVKVTVIEGRVYFARSPGVATGCGVCRPPAAAWSGEHCLMRRGGMACRWRVGGMEMVRVCDDARL